MAVWLQKKVFRPSPLGAAVSMFLPNVDFPVVVERFVRKTLSFLCFCQRVFTQMLLSFYCRTFFDEYTDLWQKIKGTNLSNSIQWSNHEIKTRRLFTVFIRIKRWSQESVHISRIETFIVISWTIMRPWLHNNLKQSKMDVKFDNRTILTGHRNLQIHGMWHVDIPKTPIITRQNKTTLINHQRSQTNGVWHADIPRTPINTQQSNFITKINS